MKKVFTVAIIGFGGRGQAYGDLMKNRPEEFKVVAVCDFDPVQQVNAKKMLGLTDEAIFADENEFFKEKRADALIIATYDREHVRQCITALELGYDVLLEKPISDNREEITSLLDVQKKTGGKVVVCHVLRYAAGFVKCAELLREGAVGKLYAIDSSERVDYWHMAQAYVRGQWNDIEYSHPTILAKCCHDLDLVQSYAGAKCKTVSSLGGLEFFKPENAPEGSADRCTDCKYVDTCPYSAKRIYIDMWKNNGCSETAWPYSKVVPDYPITEEKLYKGIQTNNYGRCAFKCGNNLVDRQYVQMDFENGVIASHKMVFAAEGGRRIAFYGDYGEMIFDERPNTIEVKKFGEKPEVISVNKLNEGGYGHGGGDFGLVSNLYDILCGKPNRTSLAESLESHLIGIAAEESRKQGGKLVSVH